MICSGGYAYMITREKGYYASLLQKYGNSESIATDEIDKVGIRVHLTLTRL